VNSGIYTAYSGMQAQLDALDILANNLANVNTTGFKEQNAFFTVLNQSLEDPGKSASLNAVLNRSIQTDATLNPAAGSLVSTGRDLDIAIEGNGFLVVDTPHGTRYTRNGSLHRSAQAVLTTSEGSPVRGDSGRPITLGPGTISISAEGSVSLDGAVIDRLKIVSFDDLSTLQKEGNSLFASRANPIVERKSDAQVRSGYLEQSNVNAVTSIVRMVELLRHFESIRKSVDLIMNDINPKAIDKLGR